MKAFFENIKRQGPVAWISLIVAVLTLIRTFAAA